MPEAKPPGGAVRALARWRMRPPLAARPTIAANAARILILKPHDQLGDLLLATPALRALRERYPRARIALLTREFLAPLAQRVPDLDRVWVLPRITGPRSLGAMLATVAAVMRFRPDLAFVMNSVSRSKSADAHALLSGPRMVVGRTRVFAGPPPQEAPEDSGLEALEKASRDPVYDLDVEVGKGSVHQTERLLDLVRWCTTPHPSPALRLRLSDADRLAGRARIDDALRGVPAAPVEAIENSPPIVGFHPGAANELKCWPLESFVALGAGLAAPAKTAAPPRLVVFDSPRERGRAAALVAGLGARGIGAGLVPAAGIEEFAAACAALDLLVCNDSGVMHIAAALDVPIVSFHSLGHPGEWGPRGDRAIAFYAPQGIGGIPVEGALAAVRALLAIPRRG